MRKPVILALLFSAACLVLPQTIAAQTNEPILVVTCTQSGELGDTSYQTYGQAVLKLCTYWEGQAGGMPSNELYKLRRSVKGLKTGERLQFYASIMTGYGTDSDGATADMVSIGDGLSKTTLKGPQGNHTFEDKPHQLPASAYPDATIIRTDKGAVLYGGGLYGPNNKGEGYFYGVCLNNAELSKKERDNFMVFQISEAELDQWENLSKSRAGSARGPGGDGSWTYSVVITARIPDLGGVAVEVEGYDEWIPQADTDDETKSGSEIRIRAWVHKTGEPKSPLNQPVTFTFELVKVGREKGLCANWPTMPGESSSGPDIRIDEDKNPTLEQINLYEEARTRKPVNEVKLVLSSFDYGGWCVLKVKAEDKDGRPIKVVYVQRKDSADISIPKDEDHNRIADAWQKENDVMGLPADWDEAEVEGQDVKGDGLSLYQKYRGFVVASAGGHRYIRLKPREKAHFVIDPQGIFDENRWFAASGIRAYKVLTAWTNSRQVDIHRGFGGGNGKWATRIELDKTKVNENASEKELTEMRSQWGVSIGAKKSRWTPRDVDVCRIYSGRITYTLRWLKAKMLQCLASPQDDSDREGQAWLLSLGIPRDELAARISRISDADLEALVKPLTAWVAIHENAHTCGLNGHLNSQGKEGSDCPGFTPDCPMQNMDWKAKWRLVLFGELGGQGKLCRTDPHFCWKHLSPKD